MRDAGCYKDLESGLGYLFRNQHAAATSALLHA